MKSKTMLSCSHLNNYMVLQPDKAGPLVILRFLWSNYIAEGEETFIQCPNDKKEENLNRTWLIFLSLVGQMFLIWIHEPLKRFGSAIEGFLNLPSANKNFRGLFLNLLQGKVEKPDKESENYMSMLGYLDKRVKLDRSLRVLGDKKYNKALSAMAAKVAYENKAFITTTVTKDWEMELIGFYGFLNVFQKKRTTEAYMFMDKNDDTEMIFIAFRGTEPFDGYAWSTDIDISWYEYPKMGKVHGGFMKALGLQENGWPKEIGHAEEEKYAYYGIRKELRKLVLNSNKRRFIVTGHSLGGALAILFTAILAFHDEELLLHRLEGVYTFGQPRVGDPVFKNFMEEKLQTFNINYERIVYSNDIIPRVPSDDRKFVFKHFGTCLYYNSLYRGKEVKEEPNKNYFNPMEIINKFLNAVLELIRSFIIPQLEGPEYRETLLLKVFRVFGLLFPGLAAHNTYDYVNVTRLGSL